MSNDAMMECTICHAHMTNKGKIINESSPCEHTFEVISSVLLRKSVSVEPKQMVFLSAPETMARDRFVLHRKETNDFMTKFKQYMSDLQNNKTECDELLKQTTKTFITLFETRSKKLSDELQREYNQKKNAIAKQFESLKEHEEKCKETEAKNQEVWLNEKQTEERDRKTIGEINDCVRKRPKIVDFPTDLNFEFTTSADMTNAINEFGTFKSTNIDYAPQISYQHAEPKESDLEKLRMHIKVSKPPMIIPSFKNMSLLFDTTESRLCLSFRLQSNNEEKENDEGDDVLLLTVECIANSSEKSIGNWENLEKTCTMEISLKEIKMDENQKYKVTIENEFNDSKNRFIHVRARLACVTKENTMNQGEWCQENVHLIVEPDIPSRFILKIQHNKNGKFKQRVMKHTNYEYTVRSLKELIIDSFELNKNDEIVVYSQDDSLITRDEQILEFFKPNDANLINFETL